MESVIALLDKALCLCKTKRELANRLGTSEQTVQAVYKGRRHLTPAQAIALANMLDISPLRVMAQVTIEREKDPEERGRLKEGFFRRGIAGAVVFCLASATMTPENVAAKGLSVGADDARQSGQSIHRRSF